MREMLQIVLFFRIKNCNCRPDFANFQVMTHQLKKNRASLILGNTYSHTHACHTSHSAQTKFAAFHTWLCVFTVQCVFLKCFGTFCPKASLTGEPSFSASTQPLFHLLLLPNFLRLLLLLLLLLHLPLYHLLLRLHCLTPEAISSSTAAPRRYLTRLAIG